MAMANAVTQKLWALTTTETFTSYMNWQENLVYVLGLDNRFTEFMEDGFEWEDGDADDHGFESDEEEEEAPNANADAHGGGHQAAHANAANNAQHPRNAPRFRTAAQKARALHLMLGQIANYCNVIARHQIMQESTSLDSIWEMIREHFGFNVTGSRFLDLSAIRLRPGEKPADLYQRIVCFFTDNLFTRSSKLTHKGRDPTGDEKLTATIQNTIVLLWLERIHAGLPGLVKQRYGTELRNKTLASIKPEISQALDSMLEELQSGDNTRVMRMQQPNGNRFQQPRSSGFQRSGNSMPRTQQRNQQFRGNSNPRICSLCKTANIPGWDTHFLSGCKHISESDRRRMASPRVRLVDACYEQEDEEEDFYAYDGVEEVSDTIDNSLFIDNPPASSHRRVTTRKSPHMACFYDHYPAQLCLDTGSESNLISERFAQHAGIPILKQSVHQGAVQADSNSKLDVVGEVKNATVRRGVHVFKLDALVTRQDVGDIIAGEPFLEQNDIAVRSAKKQIIIGGNEVISYAKASNL